MGEQGVFHLGRKANRRLRRKILRRDGAGQPDDAKRDQHQAHPADIAPVPIGDAVVDDGRHHQRHEQLKGSLQQLEQRRQNRLLLIILQINEQLFHSFLPPSSAFDSNFRYSPEKLDLPVSVSYRIIDFDIGKL